MRVADADAVPVDDDVAVADHERVSDEEDVGTRHAECVGVRLGDNDAVGVPVGVGVVVPVGVGDGVGVGYGGGPTASDVIATFERTYAPGAAGGSVSTNA